MQEKGLDIKKLQKVPVVEFENNVSEKPLVSLCVQTYQHVNYIKQCLDGIIMQKTNFEFEILLGEDQSTDGTRETCIEYAKKYPDKIKLFLHRRENVISIAGRPTGRFNLVYNLNQASGKYIALCEGDDYWTDPLKLQKQVDFLEANEDFAICFHNANIINYNNEFVRVFNEKEIPQTTDITYILSENWYMPTASLVFRRANLQIPEWFSKVKNGDYTLQLLLTANGQKAYYFNRIMSAYKIHNDGISNMFKKQLELEKSLTQINLFFNHYTKKKYHTFINIQIAKYSLNILKKSTKFSISFWVALFRYLTRKKSITKQERNYLIGHILLPGFLQKKFIKQN